MYNYLHITIVCTIRVGKLNLFGLKPLLILSQFKVYSYQSFFLIISQCENYSQELTITDQVLRL